MFISLNRILPENLLNLPNSERDVQYHVP